MSDAGQRVGAAVIPGDVAALTQALVAVPSVNPDLDPAGQGESEIAGLVAGWLETWGYGVELVEAPVGRPSVVARLGGGSPSLILSGHLDTVGADGMEVPPFEGMVRDDRVWGRGSADMKGGVAAALAAAGCRSLLERGLRADAAVVCEPTGLAVMPAHKGFVWLGIDFQGQAAHGSRPERGVDAIRHAGLFLARLDEIDAALGLRKAHPLLGTGSIHAGTIAGGTAPSVYPSSCRLVLERRTLPGERGGAVRAEVDYLLAQLRTLVPSLDARVEVELEEAGSEVPADHPLVQLLTESVRSVGLKPAVGGMSAWVEAGLYNAAGTPAVCFGPGRIEEAHSAAESVAIPELEAAHRVLGELVRRFLS
jgi:acetylornithine deacetylase